MRKLLSANFSRLWKDKIFWLGTLFMFGLGIFVVCAMYSDMTRYNIPVLFNDCLLVYLQFIGCCTAVFLQHVYRHGI